MLAVVGPQIVVVVYLEAVVGQGHPCKLDRVLSCFVAVVAVEDNVEGCLACPSISNVLQP